MDINLRPQMDSEIGQLLDRLLIHDSNFKMADDHYFEVKTPFLINPDSRNEDWKYKIGLVFYPELLSYGTRSNGYVTTPWICVRFEVEGEETDTTRELAKWLVEKFKAVAYTPFKDEDARWNHFSVEDRRGYKKYKMYVNPDYPSGYWENHAL